LTQSFQIGPSWELSVQIGPSWELNMQYQYHVWLASICALDRQAAAFCIHNIKLPSIGAQVQHRVMSGLQGLMISEYGTCMQVNWWSNRYIQGTHFMQVIMEICTEPRHH